MKVRQLGIGIHGKKFSGKSKVSDTLLRLMWKWKQNLPPQKELHYFLFREMAFADKLKSIAQILMPDELLSRQMLCVSSENKEVNLNSLPRSPREIWKIIGEMGRQIDPDLWVKHVENKIDNYHQEPELHCGKWDRLPTKKLYSEKEKFEAQANFVFIIDDVRRENEFQSLKKRDFLLFRILGGNGSNDQHPTEVELDHLTDDYFDGIIHNEEKNSEYLNSQIDETFHRLIEPKLNAMIGFQPNVS